LNILERINSDLSLRQKIASISKINQDLCRAEEDASKAFHDKSGSDNLGIVFTSLEFLTEKLSTGRVCLFSELDTVVSEWKTFNESVKNCFRLKELANKHLSDRNFYASKGEKEKENLSLAEQKYNQTKEQFIAEVKTLEKQANKLYREWAERTAVAHYTFLKNTLEILGPTLAKEFSSLKGL